jgi:hypothetical protein
MEAAMAALRTPVAVVVQLTFALVVLLNLTV